MDDVDDVEMVDDRQEHCQTLVFVVRRQSSLSHFFVFFVVEVAECRTRSLVSPLVINVEQERQWGEFILARQQESGWRRYLRRR